MIIFEVSGRVIGTLGFIILCCMFGWNFSKCGTITCQPTPNLWVFITFLYVGWGAFVNLICFLEKRFKGLN